LVWALPVLPAFVLARSFFNLLFRPSPLSSSLFDKDQIFGFDGEFDLVAGDFDERVQMREVAGLQDHDRIGIGFEKIESPSGEYLTT
jgi:hypothetical protein